MIKTNSRTHLHGQGVRKEEQMSASATDAPPFDYVEIPDRFDEALSCVLRWWEIRWHWRTETKAGGERIELEIQTSALGHRRTEKKDAYVEDDIPGHLATLLVYRDDKGLADTLFAGSFTRPD